MATRTRLPGRAITETIESSIRGIRVDDRPFRHYYPAPLLFVRLACLYRESASTGQRRPRPPFFRYPRALSLGPSFIHPSSVAFHALWRYYSVRDSIYPGRGLSNTLSPRNQAFSVLSTFCAEVFFFGGGGLFIGRRVNGLEGF